MPGAWHVIDFGLARRYVDDSGLVMPARAETAFRGSTTYASISAHDGEDLGAPAQHHTRHQRTCSRGMLISTLE